MIGPKDGIGGMLNDDGREAGSDKGAPDASFNDVGVEPNNGAPKLPHQDGAE
jgi:hypothetical protein